MKTLKLYAKLRASLEQEQATLLAKLRELEAVLGRGEPAALPIVAAQAPAPAPSKPKGKRKMSAAGRVGIAAGARASWAKIMAAKATPIAPAPKAAAKPERRMSATARAASASFRRYWTPEADALLGKLPDKQVAQRLGCTVKAVNRRRERLGIRMGR